MRILIFGDSITQGYYDLDKGGWAQRLFLDVLTAKVRNRDNVNEAFNLGVSGNFTWDITKRLQAEAQTRRWSSEKIVLIIAVGINDSAIMDDKPLSSPQKYLTDLTELYDVARTISKDIAFVGLTSVDEALTIPWKYNSGTMQAVWRNERILEFEQVLRAFTANNSIPLVQVYESFKVGENLWADGLHPNEAGHQIIFEAVKPALAKLLT